MRYLPLLLFVFLAGCMKQELPPQEIPTCISLPYEETQKRPPPQRGGRNILFFDFDGGVVSGTSWNYAGDINYSPSGMTSIQIEQTLNRARQVYDPLSVIITDDEKVFNRTKEYNRQKIIVTTTWEWFGQAGGVAFINSFGSGNPCWVFSSLLTYNTHRISEASCHELGHTLSLYHQSVYDENCIMTAEYRPGVIMGVSYYVTNGGWYIGQTWDCNEIQNDLEKMSTVVGYK